MPQEQLNRIIEALAQLKEDTTVPRNVKSRIDHIISVLSSEQETSLKINKALNELDEISSDNNLQPFTRTQLWNISSMLEAI
ncbi:UPF0147 family protein [Candidatus Woesearchaeota archaeon]|nr:UPF0147 family protein [Candidatus Woesearchaeota archaeon]